MPVRQAVILCGGKGVRLGEIARDVPKPLVPVGGRPVLDHIIDNLAAAGVQDFILAAGHLGGRIADYYEGRDLPAGCRVRTVIEEKPLGTAGALRACGDLLDETFVLAYGDVFVDFAVGSLLATHEDGSPLATLLVRASDHPWDSHLVDVAADGRVREFVHRREEGRAYRNVANAAVYVLDRRVLAWVPADRPSDFGADVFPAMVAADADLRVHFLEEEGFVKDMGTPERLAAVEEYLEDRALAASARECRGPLEVVFLDRDGVLNVDVDLLHDPGRLELMPGAAEAVALLNRLGLRCVVLTNQPVLARGLCDEATLERIHARLRDGIASHGGVLEAIFYCPHHPETHHGEGVASLRRGCRCRKPAPGMIFEARRRLGLDLSRCAMVGDRPSDIRAGRAAGLRTVLVGDAAGRRADAVEPDARHDSLLEFARAVERAGGFPA